MEQRHSTACQVEILTPEGIRLVFDTRQAVSDLLAVQTSNDLGQPAGSFSLTFAPRRLQGRTYDQLIPLRSLVTIHMASSASQVEAGESVVMLGLTEDQGSSEDYSRTPPRRVVTILGRSLAGILLDAHLWFHPAIAGTPDGTISVEERFYNLFWIKDLVSNDMTPAEALRTVLTYFLGLQSRVGQGPLTQRRQTQQAVARRQQAEPGLSAEVIAQDMQTAQQQAPHLVPRVQSRQGSSAETLALHRQAQQDYEAFVAANPGAIPPPGEVSEQPITIETTTEMVSAPRLREKPLLNLQLPGRSLADLLDLNDHTWTLFEKDLRVDVTQNTPFAGALWNYLHLFIDPLFQEFFTRVEGGILRIHFRAKPFLQTRSLHGSRFQETLTCQTLTLTDVQLLGIQLRRQTANVYNVFSMWPYGTSTMVDKAAYQQLLPPLMLDTATDPSYLAKYGLREIQHRSPYLSAQLDSDTEMTIAAAKRWNEIAAAWYGLGSEMYAGAMTVVGSPRWNLGHRLLTTDERGAREFYIEGVTHEYDMRTGRYLTHLRVTRGWYLKGLVDERESHNGQPVS
jgi:hypothetical protein